MSDLSEASGAHTESVEVTAAAILKASHTAERLKDLLRHGWTSSGRRESVAEHSWRLAFMLVLAAPSLGDAIDVCKLLKLAIVHDIVEVYAGDVPYFVVRDDPRAREKKISDERKAAQRLWQELPLRVRDEVLALWEEYQAGVSLEARTVKAFDKIEAQIQQNEADLSTWVDCEYEDAVSGLIREYCSFNPLIASICECVIEESSAIVRAAQPSCGLLPTSSFAIIDRIPRRRKAATVSDYE